MDASTSDFILERARARTSTRPLVVGLQGPQGSGKSTLSQALYDRLTASPHALRVAFLSLDDLYKTHAELQELKRNYPENKLLHGRGQPGTHDVELGARLLEQLRNINESGATTPVALPVYDKSLFDGQGDRVTQTRPVAGPLDCIIFEGWSTGFQAVPQDTLADAYAQRILPNGDAAIKQAPLGKEHLKGPLFLRHSLESLLQINRELEAYNALWNFIDCFIQIEPADMSLTWTWRLQQEHAMKSKNGGVGMTDQEVEDFVARYMPGYECFGAGIDKRWQGALLRVVIDKERQVSKVQKL